MGRKIEDYTNNVSVTPDELSLLDVSEKTGLATYESRKWTLQQFLAWLNANFQVPSVNGMQGQIPLFVQDDEIGSNTRFTFIDNQGTEVGFRFSDSAGNLSQVGVTYLNVESQGIASNSVLRLANWADNSNKGIITFRKSRGTKTTPSQVLVNDVLGTLIFTGQAIKSFDDGFNPPTYTPTGMTTAEIVVRAMQNFSRSYSAQYDETNSSALTQYEIWLQQANASAIGDLTPPNLKVFAVDGNGVVYFRDYKFPTGTGTNGQVLTSNGAGQVVWATPSSGGVTGSGNDWRIARFNGNGSVITNAGMYDNGSSFWSESQQLSFNHLTGDFRVGTNTENLEFWASVSSGYPLTYTSHDANPMMFNYRGTSYGGISFKRTQTDGTTPPASGTTLFDIGHYTSGNIRCVTTEQHVDSGGVGGLGQYGQELRLGGVPNGSRYRNNTLRLTQDNKVKVSDVYYLPNTDGVNGQTLVTDGAGNITWGGSQTANFIPFLQGHETFRGLNYSNNSTTDVTSGGFVSSTATGAAVIARSISSSNYYSKVIRKGYYRSTVNAGGLCQLRGSALLWFLGSGFKFVCDVAITDSAFGSGCRQFYGLLGQTTDVSYNDSVLVSSMLNVIGVGSDSADANLQIFHNDGTGTCTKIDLGANFPANRTASVALTTMYGISIYNAPNATSVKIQVINKETGAISQNTLNSNLPLDSQGLNIYA